MSILIDTGVFYAFYNRRDKHHLDSLCLLTHILEGVFGKPYTSDLVVSETYTLLRYRVGFGAANAFLDALGRSGIEVVFLDKELYSETLRILRKYRDRKLSFTDAAILAIAGAFEIKYLASYDEQAFSGLLTVVGRNYGASLPEKEVDRIKKLAGRM